MDNATDFYPWERYPELTTDRLSLVACIIRDARARCAELHEPEEGDAAWDFGCRCYSRTCFGIDKASLKNSWLTIPKDTEKPLRFCFAIGHVPFRFYRGDPDDPPSRYLAVNYPELRERQLGLDLGVAVPVDSVLRFAIEADNTGRASRVSLVELDELGELTGVYQIPFEAARPAIVLRTKPIETPPAIAEPVKPKKKKEARKNFGEERNVSNG
jgi:hypothetical protein